MEKASDISFLSALWPFTGIIFLVVSGVLVLNYQFNKRLYRKQLEEEQLRAQHRLDLLRTSISVQETERKRMARDMHDELGATLSMARMHLVQIGQQCAQSDAALAARVANVQHITEKALEAMRRISHALMPPQLESFGLLQTLDAIAAQSGGALRITVNAPAHFPRLPRETELGLYRIAMELISNTIRHAGATQAQLELDMSGGRVRFSYRDNGKGLPEGAGKNGIGLKSMETRAQAMGGTFALENQPGGGILARVELPAETAVL